MYHRSDSASKLILISLISVLFSASESLQTRQRRANENLSTQEELDSHCPADFGKQEITSWKNDCNDCFCIDIMKAACTRMKCTGEHYAVSLGAEEQKADPRCVNNTGNSWKEDCNNCFCVSNPPVVACTRKLCVTPPSDVAPQKVKRDIRDDLSKHFEEENKMQGDQPAWTPSPLFMNSGTQLHPNVWIATAALSVITAVLARI